MAQRIVNTIKDVIFVYTSAITPVKQLNKDNKPPLSNHALEFHSYEVKIMITETRFKHFKKQYRGAKNLPNVKEVTPEEFVEKYTADIGLPEEDLVMIKFSQGCLWGTASSRRETKPIKVIGIKKQTLSSGVIIYKDNNGIIINENTDIGNGTKGHLQFSPVEGKFGLYLYPSALCITELQEYAAVTEYTKSDEEFGVVDIKGNEDEEEPEVAESDNYEDESPF